MGKIKVGLTFIFQNEKWIVKTNGIKNYWGVECIRTNAFISMCDNEILKVLNKSNKNPLNEKI